MSVAVTAVEAKVQELLATGIWKEQVDKKSQRVYYYCKSTRETTWDIKSIAAALLSAETNRSSAVDSSSSPKTAAGGATSSEVASPKEAVAQVLQGGAKRRSLLGPFVSKYEEETLALLLASPADVIPPNLSPSAHSERYLCVAATPQGPCQWCTVTISAAAGRLAISAEDKVLLPDGRYTLHVDRSAAGVVCCILPSKPLLAQAAFRIVAIGCSVLPGSVDFVSSASATQPGGRLVAVVEDCLAGSGLALAQRLARWCTARTEEAGSGCVPSGSTEDTRSSTSNQLRCSSSAALSSLLAEATQEGESSQESNQRKSSRLLCLKATGVHEAWERRVCPQALKAMYARLIPGNSSAQAAHRSPPQRQWVRGASSSVVDGIVAELRAAELALDSEIRDLKTARPY